MDGKRLNLQLSQNTPSANQKSAVQKPKAEDGQGTKLVVRNVAFEATRKDIVSLFSPFGQIKSCRLPSKFDGTPRCASLTLAERESWYNWFIGVDSLVPWSRCVDQYVPMLVACGLSGMSFLMGTFWPQKYLEKCLD